MVRVAVFTSANVAYVDRVHVLMESLRRVEPDWDTYVMDAGRGRDSLRDFCSPAINVLESLEVFAEWGLQQHRSWAEQMSVVEYATAIKPSVFEYLFSKHYDMVFYLDPDTVVFSGLGRAVNALMSHDIVLTPHLIRPKMSVAQIYPERDCLRLGAYNLGFLGVARRPEGIAFIRWWSERLRWFWQDDPSNGLFVDQKWIDLVPSLFSRVHVLRDAGYNVASWNVRERPLTMDARGSLSAAGERLVFFHFTKIPGVGVDALMRESGGSQLAAEMVGNYMHRLKRFADFPKGYVHSAG